MKKLRPREMKQHVQDSWKVVKLRFEPWFVWLQISSGSFYYAETPHLCFFQSMSRRSGVKEFQKSWDITYVEVNLRPSVINRVRQKLLGNYRICILPTITQLWNLLNSTSHKTICSFVHLTKSIECWPYCRHFSSSWGNTGDLHRPGPCPQRASSPACRTLL